MKSILSAIYKNGTLVLDKRLGGEKEGKKFKIILFEQDSNKAKKERFFRFIEKQAFNMAKDYKFDREELHER
jgi:hypothetical protein